jgi:flavorubredoxin
MSARGAPTLPREIAPDTYWLSTCLPVTDGGRTLHNHNSCYLVIGEAATLLIDTGMPYGWDDVQAEIRQLLAGRPLDYVFPTHPEAPHMGNCGPLMQAYPDLMLVGDLRNYHLYYPGCEARFMQAQAGDGVDLGGRIVEFVPAIVRDLPNTLWAWDTRSRILFVSDAFPYTHEHEAGQCGLLSEELPVQPRAESCELVIERALSWTRYVDPQLVCDDLRTVLGGFDIDLIAPAHGGVITDPAAFLSIFEAGLRRVRARHD